MTESESTGSNLTKRLANHPYVTLVLLILAVAAIVVSLILFFASQSHRALVYAVNPIQTRVVTRGQATGIDISFDGRKLGDVDITAVQVAVWNSGDQSIRVDNVLKQVVVRTDPAVPILEASVVKYYRDQDVTGFSIVTSPELLDTGRVPLNWKILERNDGAVIQLIYLGSPEVEIKAEGLIEGFGSIKRVESGLKIRSPSEQLRSAQQERWLFWGFSVFVLVGTFFAVREGVRDWRRKEKVPTIIDFVFVLFCLGLFGCYVFIATRVSGPPFGF